MDSKHHATVEPIDEKPAIVAHLDDKSELGPDKHAAAVDYTGAERKSDPEEIALVRKIDWRLMVRTVHCFPLKSKSWDESRDESRNEDWIVLKLTRIIADINGHVLFKLC